MLARTLTIMAASASLLLSACDNRTGCNPDCDSNCCGDDGCGATCPDTCPDTGQFCDPSTCTCGQCLEMGLDCTDSYQCCSGWCLKFSGEPSGYCSGRDCVSDRDCVNHSDDGAEMCCVDVGGEYFFCMKIAPGYGCSNDPWCGVPCVAGDDSYCHPSQVCVSDEADESYCAHECVTNTDCNDCTDPENPDAIFTCQAISGGAPYCLKYEIQTCASNRDCEGEDVCIPWPTEDAQNLEGMCNKLGDLPTGAECDSEADPNELPASERCAGFYCFNDHCSAVCTLENDCPEDMFCHTFNFCMDDACDLIASIGMCYWLSGSLTDCAGNDDCPQGEICDYYLPPNGSVTKVCTDWTCDPDGFDCAGPGEDCGQGLPTCYTGLCLMSQGSDNGWCSALCYAHSDCPTGMICGLLGVSDTETTGACVPFDGSGDPCGSDADCPDGEVCDYFVSPAGGVESLCTVPPSDCGRFGDPCGPYLDPCCYNDPCVPGGEGSLCSRFCQTSEGCPDGFVCVGMWFPGDPNVYGACFPGPGTGDPCGSDADCVEGEACFYDQTPTGDIETLCLEGVEGGAAPGEACDQDTPCFNDLCLTIGYCSAVCATNSDCAGHLVDGEPMECTYIGLGGDDYGTACVATDEDSPLCTLCAANEECQGDAMCIESTANPPERYCALACPTGDECPPGSTCTDVGGAVRQCIPDGDTCVP